MHENLGAAIVYGPEGSHGGPRPSYLHEVAKAEDFFAVAKGIVYAGFAGTEHHQIDPRQVEQALIKVRQGPPLLLAKENERLFGLAH